jgi:hypothetical protein
VRIDLPCAPCNRVRLPPQRCQGHTPDCLQGVTVDAVVRAALELRDLDIAPTAAGGDNAKGDERDRREGR